MAQLAEKVYESSPVFMQNMLLSVYGVQLYRMRYRGSFEAKLNDLMESQWYSADRLRALQEKRLATLVRGAFEAVPFYRQCLLEKKLLPADVNLDNFAAIFPSISKAEINRDPKLFIAQGALNRRTVRVNTSGTSGSPLSIYTTREAVQENYAFFARFLRWSGVQERQRSATFAGRIIIPKRQTRPPFWRKNLVMNNELFSSYHLSQQFLPEYVKELNRLAPEFIDSYPSAVYTLASYMLQNGLKLQVSPKAIVTSSETLFDHQRTIIEEAFGCSVRDQYGSAEAAAFIAQCEKSSYHVNSEYGIVEILDAAGQPSAPGEPGEMVCTGFLNETMPFIRYRIGDSAILSSERCECGRALPVIKQLIGRIDDIIVTPEGNQVGRLDPIFKGLSSIKETQIIQEAIDRLTVKLVPGAGFESLMADVLVGELRKRVGESIRIDVEIVDEIPRSKSGKFKAVLSRLHANPVRPS